MTAYKITYIVAGSGEQPKTDWIIISSADEKLNGTRINNIVEAIEYFEETARIWGTYENRNAIVDITVSEIR